MVGGTGSDLPFPPCRAVRTARRGIPAVDGAKLNERTAPQRGKGRSDPRLFSWMTPGSLDDPRLPRRLRRRATSSPSRGLRSGRGAEGDPYPLTWREPITSTRTAALTVRRLRALKRSRDAWWGSDPSVDGTTDAFERVRRARSGFDRRAPRSVGGPLARVTSTRHNRAECRGTQQGRRPRARATASPETSIAAVVEPDV